MKTFRACVVFIDKYGFCYQNINVLQKNTNVYSFHCVLQFKKFIKQNNYLNKKIKMFLTINTMVFKSEI